MKAPIKSDDSSSRANNPYGSKGTAKCATCRSRRQKCVFTEPLDDCRRCQIANLPCGKKVLASSAAKKAPCVMDKDLTYLMSDLNFPSAKPNLRALLIKSLEALKEGSSPISVWNDVIIYTSQYIPPDFGVKSIQPGTINSEYLQPSVVPTTPLESSVNFSTAWSNLITNVELVEKFDDMAAILEKLEGILQHHFSSVDPDVIKRVVEMVGTRFKNGARSTSPTHSTSTVPDNGSPHQQNRSLKNYAAHTYTDYLEPISLEQAFFSHSLAESKINNAQITQMNHEPTSPYSFCGDNEHESKSPEPDTIDLRRYLHKFRTESPLVTEMCDIEID